MNKRLTIFLGISALLLLIPLIAMQFTNAVKWSGFDFLLMGIMLVATSLTVEIILRKVKTAKARLLLAGLVLLCFLLLWAELAVGIFGSPIAGS